MKFKWGPYHAAPGQYGWRLKTNEGHEAGVELTIPLYYAELEGVILEDPECDTHGDPLPVEVWS